MSALGPQDRNRVCIAALAGAHGVRGAVRLKLFTQTPEAIAHYSPLYLEHSDTPITLRLTGPIKGGWAARLDGVDNRDQAQALSGKKLYTTREALEAAALSDADQEEDSYFLADLAGLSVLSPTGAPLGVVRTAHDFGSGDLLELTLDAPAPGLGKSVLLPFERRFVPDVDLAGRQITVDLALWLDLQNDSKSDISEASDADSSAP
ncbi:ribosome maturation factor RimM [Iodidimonas muriae]|uniref:Ribosome maturation factor RimM n=1 Tax=Iodidimonas muriae TaxID=261467 RepID=A0ABQ2LFG8_9PROT|nr:ribosome maturation factor RimM [Iodidimonas muriae]GER07893.1 ribosome maturation factor RimM [Kordiimonadales bacterium JCM 17843]GGO11981.1 ribosome maturation factor RimM [Iodidimonas muriae]